MEYTKDHEMHNIGEKKITKIELRSSNYLMVLNITNSF